MVRIHFVDGNHIDVHYTTYDEVIKQLNENRVAKWINFVDATVLIDNITYIERKEVEA